MPDLALLESVVGAVDFFTGLDVGMMTGTLRIVLWIIKDCLSDP